jgi:hypothetical protein
VNGLVPMSLSGAVVGGAPGVDEHKQSAIKYVPQHRKVEGKGPGVVAH